MNIQKYAKILADYNNVYNFKVHNTNIIIVPFKENKWVDRYLSRIESFDKVLYHCKRPLVKAFKSFYRTDCITSVFLHHNNNHSILMGNERILYSHPRGDVFLCLTPFWIKNKSCISLQGGGVDNIFPYKNVVLFLDEFQIPYPGGCYYTKNSRRRPSSSSDEQMRICFITRDLSALEDIFLSWNGRPNVQNYPFITQTTILSISKFIDPLPIENFSAESAVVKSTNLISKKLSRSNPNFLLQDILNTYRQSSGSVDNVGLFIEYPFECDYENSCGNAEDGTCNFDNDKSLSDESPKQYVAFYVNGLNPKKILHVRRPYDRYMEYENYTPNIHMKLWTKILYDPEEELPVDVSRVIIDNTILGYKYKNAFLCLGYPALSSVPVVKYNINSCGSKNLDTDCLLTPINDEDLKLDADIYVIDEYYYDRQHKLYHIKHKKIRNDLWCLSRLDSKNAYSSDTTSCKVNLMNDDQPPSKYPKLADPPLFVSKWLSFYNENKDRNDLNFGNLTLFKLSLILARHKICFKLKRGTKREILFLMGEYEIRLEEPLVNYINEIRLLPVDDNSDSTSCTVVTTTQNQDGDVNDNNDENEEGWCGVS